MKSLIELFNKLFSKVDEKNRKSVALILLGVSMFLILLIVVDRPEDKNITQLKNRPLETISLVGDSYDALDPAALASDINVINKTLERVLSTQKHTEEKYKRDLAVKNKEIKDLQNEATSQKRASTSSNDITTLLIHKQKERIKELEDKAANPVYTPSMDNSAFNSSSSVSASVVDNSQNTEVIEHPDWYVLSTNDTDIQSTENLVVKPNYQDGSAMNVPVASSSGSIHNITMTEENGTFSLIDETGSGDMVLNSFDEEEKQTQEALDQAEEEEKTVYLPAGSIIAGKLLTGGDFPTSIGYKNDPYPVLLRIKKEAILPNYAVLDIRECFILGEGHGELSSERVMIRATTISCVREDGGSVEADLNAYATGGDGKIGIRGELVSKEGAMIGRALLAGFVSGVSQAFRPLGALADAGDALNLPSGKEVGRAAGLSGMGSAMDRLSTYYVEMAEQVFPVIEISAQRNVEFILKRGAKLSLK